MNGANKATLKRRNKAALKKLIHKEELPFPKIFEIRKLLKEMLDYLKQIIIHGEGKYLIKKFKR